MIFITVGSQKFQFDRLLKAVDSLIEKGAITEKVFAQTGYCEYVPKNYEYKSFLDRDEFADMVEQSEIIITHGGTGAIIGAVKNHKKVIAVPRRAMFGEHVDDHQLQLVGQFKELNLIYECRDCDELGEAVKRVKNMQFNEYHSNTKRIVASIDKFLTEGVK